MNCSEPENKQILDEFKEAGSEESDLELELEDVVAAEWDDEPSQIIVCTEKDVSEDDIEKSDEKKKEALEWINQEKYQEAIDAFSQAILLNPKDSISFTKRGGCYLQMKKPSSCIRDCNRALEINPDSAEAYKLRGRSQRLLGKFVEAAQDLRMACRIDYDEQTDDWLREVTPHARKIEERRRKHERKKLEREFNELKERMGKMKEELKMKLSERMDQAEKTVGEDFSEMDDTIINLISDGDILTLLRDSEVQDALTSKDNYFPKLLKYMDNPKMILLFEKLGKIFCGRTPDEVDQISARMRILIGEALLEHSDSNSQTKNEVNVEVI